jgi:ribosome-binding protein aMBF1 (putative translation factor)
MKPSKAVEEIAQNSQTVRAARAIKGMDMRMFANLLGCSYSLISRMESADREVSKKNLIICKNIIKKYIQLSQEETK